MEYTYDKIYDFLQQVDHLFPIPLSQKQPLHTYTEKLCAFATICSATQNEKIVSMVAGYTKNAENNIGYISLVATLPQLQGKGHASKLIKDFLTLAHDDGLSAVHLYTTPNNHKAIKMYESIGFVPFVQENEPRQHDIHLIYHLRRDNE